MTDNREFIDINLIPLPPAFDTLALTDEYTQVITHAFMIPYWYFLSRAIRVQIYHAAIECLVESWNEQEWEAYNLQALARAMSKRTED